MFLDIRGAVFACWSYSGDYFANCLIDSKQILILIAFVVIDNVGLMLKHKKIQRKKDIKIYGVRIM